ncbi:MAG: DUF1559 domain-containing protein [Planctomycetia bacterium]|nr:DUF1559 domain-containing protein [Planctomycetia bacterium]
MGSHRIFRRQGFTLTELLTVIAIIGLLVGLLVPGVQSAREAARRSTCANNMRQLGQGLQQFHTARGALPVPSVDGYIYNSSSPAFQAYARARLAATGAGMSSVYNWVVAVYPFVEQQTFYDKFNLSQGSTGTVNQPLITTPSPILICPSDPDAADPILPRRAFLRMSSGSSTDASGARIHGLWYAGSAGPSREAGSNQFCPTGSAEWCWISTPSPIGPMNMLDTGNKVGMLGHRWFPTRFDDAQDGLSNTFLLVETRPRFSPYNTAYPGPSGNSNSDYSVTLSAPINAAMPSTSSPFLNPTGQFNFAQTVFSKSPRSMHPGGCHMLLCDGAVVFFSEFTPLQLLCRLGNRKDGEIAIVP